MKNIQNCKKYILIWSVIAIIASIIWGAAGFFWSRDKGSKHKFGSALIGIIEYQVIYYLTS
ncbi:DUF6518 family protein [Clostridium pasteurianum]|uniref:DUF6518 family protein n=1 Tax=Clostridium pasteurianum TaxID=1501 RepID=UPI003BFA67B0